MDYTLLNAQQKQDMLKQRTLNLEAEHFQHQMNIDGFKMQYEAAEDPVVRQNLEDQIMYAEKAQETIDQAHAEVLAKIEEVKVEAETEKEKTD